MTHRERVPNTFAFQQTDRIACDLMEGRVWLELLEYFQLRHGCATTVDVLELLDTDFRWIQRTSDRKESAGVESKPKPANASQYYTKENVTS